MEQVLKKETVIYDKSQLLELFISGCKPKEKFKIGLEFEKLAVNSFNYKAVPYSGKNGISDFLLQYKIFDKMEKIFIDGNLLGLKDEWGYISLEPGCQTEISVCPTEKISEIASIIQDYNFKTSFVAQELGIYWLGYGIQPVSTFANIEIIPKTRYDIMANYLPSKGGRSLVMMKETAGIQTSIDYDSEEDAMKKLSLAVLISPIITAIFSNSPVRNGKDTGYKSYRAYSWLDTDNDRCGFIDRRIFENHFSFEDYAEYLLDVPMFFIERNNAVINATHLTFREFWKNGYAGFQAEIKDWETHATTVFPEVRLKNYIEIRNCDSQKNDLILAMPTLIKGIMYDETAMNQARELMKDFSWQDLQQMRDNVPKFGLETVINNIKISDIAKELVNIAEISLVSNPQAKDDAVYLEKLKELVSKKTSPADIIIKNWNSCWNKNIEKLVEYSKLT